MSAVGGLVGFFVGDVTGSRGFLIVGDFFGSEEDFLGDNEGGVSEGCCFARELKGREGDVLDFEGGLATGLELFAFKGELELLPGSLAPECDFIGSEEGMLDRACSRSLRNLGKECFLDILLSPSLLEKLICHAKPS